MNKKILLFCAGLFMVSFCMSPILSNITVTFWPNIFGSELSLIMLWGSFYYTIGRVFLDVIQEFYGKQTRTQVVKITLIIRLITYFMIFIGLVLPISTTKTGADKVINTALRMTVAGLIDMFLTQYLLDPFVYSKIAKRMKGKMTFMRGFLSNFASTIVHAIVFFHLAFWDKLNFLFLWLGDKDISKPYNYILDAMLSDPLLDIPFLLLSSAFGAFVIWLIKKKTGMKSMRDTGGIDIGNINLEETKHE